MYKSQEPAGQSLVEAAKGGHSTAFGALCERYTQQLLRAAHRITRNREDSEDAVQDALLRAFVHLRDFDGRSEEHTSELQSLTNLVCRLLLEKKKNYAYAAVSRTVFLSASRTF